MDNMVEFGVGMLEAIPDFLSAEPICYLFGLVLLCFVCKAIKVIMWD